MNPPADSVRAPTRGYHSTHDSFGLRFQREPLTENSFVHAEVTAAITLIQFFVCCACFNAEQGSWRSMNNRSNSSQKSF